MIPLMNVLCIEEPASAAALMKCPAEGGELLR